MTRYIAINFKRTGNISSMFIVMGLRTLRHIKAAIVLELILLSAVMTAVFILSY